jgi:hypothetical protein
MDWSVFQRHAAHPMLRSELIYSNHIPVSADGRLIDLFLANFCCPAQLYYFAIVSVGSLNVSPRH